MGYVIPHDQYAISWADVLQVGKKYSSSVQLQVSLQTVFACPADKIWRLRRDYERSELPSQLGVPYDLLEAANPDGLHDLRAGKTISLGKHASKRLAGYNAVRLLCACRSGLQSASKLHCCSTSMCLQELPGR